tara:strand:+ start:7302 stop:8051 length:750 start_codon:yes stop_codon:yes gene_type:complete
MVDINKVYTTVLYILNKEQRGYIPPAEFNSLATQVQKEIFNSYFPDGNQLNRANQKNIQNDTEFFNMFKDNAFKVAYFEQEVDFVYNGVDDIWTYNNPSRSLYRTGEIISTYDGNPTLNSVTEFASKKEFTEITNSKLTSPTTQYPLCYITNVLSASFYIVALKISPQPDSVKVNCIVNPRDPLWAFTTGSLGQYLYDFNNSVMFEIDESEQTNLITGILKYAGVIIRDPEIIQAATQEAAKVQQNEKA